MLLSCAKIVTGLKQRSSFEPGLLKEIHWEYPGHIYCHAQLDRPGIRAVKEAPKRIQAARERSKKLGVEIKQLFLTSGEFDLLAIVETADANNIPKWGSGDWGGRECARRALREMVI